MIWGKAKRAVRLASWAAGISLLASPAFPREIATPAELPPADYRGQQYVDSKGCLFMRAGHDGQTVWLPRVTRDGVPLCGNPPSGNRVPAVGEAGAGKAFVPAEEPSATATAPAVSGTGAYMVAVGSFSVMANADRAMLRLAVLGFPARRGSVQRGAKALDTVFAGPFDSATAALAARDALRGQGFPDAMLIGP